MFPFLLYFRNCSLFFTSQCAGQLVPLHTFTKEQLLLLKIRTGVTAIAAVCSKHKVRYLDMYAAMQLKCCDPLRKHNTSVKPQKEISIEMHFQSKIVSQFSTPLIPGDKLCKRCALSVCSLLKDVVLDETAPSTSSASSSQESSGNLIKDYLPYVLREAGSVHNVIFGPANPSVVDSIAGPSSAGEPIALMSRVYFVVLLNLWCFKPCCLSLVLEGLVFTIVCLFVRVSESPHMGELTGNILEKSADLFDDADFLKPTPHVSQGEPPTNSQGNGNT